MKQYLINLSSCFFYVLICLVLLSKPVLATSSILLLGDSISASYGMKQNEGWVHLLNNTLEDKGAAYILVNASISGETTGGGLKRLPSLLKQNKVNHLIIELGGNDGLRGFSPKLIKNNLLQTIQLAQDKNIPVSIMQIKIPPNYGPRYNQLFEKIFIDVAQEKNIPLMPFFMNEIAIKPELMQADGIHPNKQAQPIIANMVEKQLINNIIINKN